MLQIVAKSPYYEKGRFLLTCLILANCGNIEIIHHEQDNTSDEQLIVNGTQLRLLTRDQRNFADAAALGADG